MKRSRIVLTLLRYADIHTGTHVPGPFRIKTSENARRARAGLIVSSFTEYNKDLMKVGGVVMNDWWTCRARGSVVIR